MIISEMRVRSSGEHVEAYANVTWENNDRPDVEVHFRVPAEFAGYVLPTSDALLAAGCYLSAWHGETRLLMEGEVCPYLRFGLEMAARVQAHWWGMKLPRLELECRSHAREVPPPHTALLLSGGVDSLYTLLRNRRLFPSEHPAAIKDGVVLQKLARPNYNRRAWRGINEIAEDAGIRLITMESNLRDLDASYALWAHTYQTATLIGCAHVLGNGITNLMLADSPTSPLMELESPHPLIDHLYSSYELRVRLCDFDVNRFAKVKELAQWPAAIDNLYVCNYLKPLDDDVLNCGRCPKCVRTRLGLIAAGIEVSPDLFADKTPIDPAFLWTRYQVTPAEVFYIDEILNPLHEVGRSDLATTLSRKRRLVEFNSRFLGSVGARPSRFASRLVGRAIREKNRFLTRDRTHP